MLGVSEHVAQNMSPTLVRYVSVSGIKCGRQYFGEHGLVVNEEDF